MRMSKELLNIKPDSSTHLHGTTDVNFSCVILYIWKRDYTVNNVCSFLQAIGDFCVKRLIKLGFIRNNFFKTVEQL